MRVDIVESISMKAGAWFGFGVILSLGGSYLIYKGVERLVKK